MVNFSILKNINQKLVFIVVSITIVTVSMLFTNKLARSLSIEEQKRVLTWAKATEQLINANENTDIDFVSSIIEENTSIPVIMTNEAGNVISTKNIDLPLQKTNENYQKELERLKKKHEPIVVQINNTHQYIFHDDSLLLKQLYYFPYIQLGIIIIFLLVAFFAFFNTMKAEQNQVWVGLSKETAHQLGTPISSLLAWIDLLKLRHKDEKLLPEIEKDVNRLRIIAERFSKIGSKPHLQPTPIFPTLSTAVQYISNRSSQKVILRCHFDKDDYSTNVQLNIPLFEWVIENLCKNAIDAMNGEGEINIFIKILNENVIIDFTDSGKGLPKNMYKTIFKPGFTTKPRGWGLGLSLAKRIIEEYHKGKIFVKHSEINIGTTFRIILNIQK